MIAAHRTGERYQVPYSSPGLRRLIIGSSSRKHRSSGMGSHTREKGPTLRAGAAGAGPGVHPGRLWPRPAHSPSGGFPGRPQARVGAVHLIPGDPGGRCSRVQGVGDHPAGHTPAPPLRTPGGSYHLLRGRRRREHRGAGRGGGPRRFRSGEHGQSRSRYCAPAIPARNSSVPCSGWLPGQRLNQRRAVGLAGVARGRGKRGRDRAAEPVRNPGEDRQGGYDSTLRAPARTRLSRSLRRGRSRLSPVMPSYIP
jgi:hypothetical protein